MDVDIHSTIFQPLADGEPYLVVVSALPIDQRHPPRRSATRSSAASSYGEAMAQCENLARTLLDLLTQCGDRVCAVHCRWNPTCALCSTQ